MEQQGIAIIGMACRFPGGADSPEALWSLLLRALSSEAEAEAEKRRNRMPADPAVMGGRR